MSLPFLVPMTLRATAAALVSAPWPTATARMRCMNGLPVACEALLADDTIRLAQDFERHREPEAVGNLEIEREDRIDRLDRKIARPRPFRDLVDVLRDASAGLERARPVARERSPVGHE